MSDYGSDCEEEEASCSPEIGAGCDFFNLAFACGNNSNISTVCWTRDGTYLKPSSASDVQALYQTNGCLEPNILNTFVPVKLNNKQHIHKTNQDLKEQFVFVARLNRIASFLSMTVGFKSEVQLAMPTNQFRKLRKLFNDLKRQYKVTGASQKNKVSAAHLARLVKDHQCRLKTMTLTEARKQQSDKIAWQKKMEQLKIDSCSERAVLFPKASRKSKDLHLTKALRKTQRAQQQERERLVTVLYPLARQQQLGCKTKVSHLLVTTYAKLHLP